MNLHWVMPANGIMVIDIPAYSETFKFEWHQLTGTVYCLDLKKLAMSSEPDADVVAVDIRDHGSAINAVLIWCRGYKKCLVETKEPDLYTGRSA